MEQKLQQKYEMKEQKLRQEYEDKMRLVYYIKSQTNGDVRVLSKLKCMNSCFMHIGKQKIDLAKCDDRMCG